MQRLHMTLRRRKGLGMLCLLQVLREPESKREVEQAQHRRQSPGHGQPFVDLPDLVDAHADQEDDDFALHLGRDSFSADFGHAGN